MTKDYGVMMENSRKAEKPESRQNVWNLTGSQGSPVGIIEEGGELGRLYDENRINARMGRLFKRN
jgi:hypothetical protein